MILTAFYRFLTLIKGTAASRSRLFIQVLRIKKKPRADRSRLMLGSPTTGDPTTGIAG
jgi:hypothetical protein